MEVIDSEAGLSQLPLRASALPELRWLALPRLEEAAELGIAF